MPMPPPKKKTSDRDRIERAAKRSEQKAAGALDGRFREKVVKSKKVYSRKRKPKADPSDGSA